MGEWPLLPVVHRANVQHLLGVVSLGAVVLSAISSAVIERWFLGDESLFRVPAYHLEHWGELGAYASLGVIGGFASLIFVKYIAYLRPKLRRYPAWTQYFQPAAAGLLIGFIGIKFSQVMGAGYGYIDQAMHEQYTWQILAILGGLKILATGLSFSSGTPGGLFAPTLFMGAMIGGAVGMAERADASRPPRAAKAPRVLLPATAGPDHPGSTASRKSASAGRCGR